MQTHSSTENTQMPNQRLLAYEFGGPKRPIHSLRVLDTIIARCAAKGAHHDARSFLWSPWRTSDSGRTPSDHRTRRDQHTIRIERRSPGAADRRKHRTACIQAPLHENDVRSRTSAGENAPSVRGQS